MCNPAKRCCRTGMLAFQVAVPLSHWHERVPTTYSRSLENICCARSYDVFHVGTNPGGQGTAPVVSIDNLLCDLRELARRYIFGRAPGRGARPAFQPSGLAFPGLDAPAPNALRRAVERCLAPIARAELGLDLFRIPSSSAASFLRVLTKPATNWSSTQLFPHIDYAASVAATVGIGEFTGTSVGFYAARAVGQKTVLKDLSDIALYKLQGVASFAADLASGGGGGGGGTGDASAATRHFELLLRRSVLANRALAYPAWLLHRAIVPADAAERLCPDPERGRLTINLFYTTDDHPIRRGVAPASEPPDGELLAYLQATIVNEQKVTGRKCTRVARHAPVSRLDQ
eukprot:CAMPEP_0204515596 /NCGR_PEP_ID=MMETSP0661-20131031/2706_1 /ASSEMBLY_ACC=CAM_ASM_000606 /TAXON_ID=109239 /ORGANISM="Alexandrium margalefi, Strain AMGDE01CS-322" /LENGTH=343 /DNA_ID=CAMNT_0051520923 /DNA_START=27 /DNA_END=1056 /DNA_ORIENTATION=-